MPVSEFECQIARGQIGRYLDGGVLSPEAMNGLEGHLAECSGCKGLVAQRRAALLSALDEVPTRAVVSMPVENPLIAALRAKAETVEAPAKPEPKAKPAPRYAKGPAAKGGLGKPLALAALLAIVLLGMSRLSHVATAPAARADASFAAEALPAAPPPAKPHRGVAHKMPAPAPGSSAKPKAGLREDRFEEISTPTPTRPPASKAIDPGKGKATPLPHKPSPAKKPLAPLKPGSKSKATTRSVVRIRRVARTMRRVKPLARKRPHLRKPKAPRSSVRVYGLDGRPLKP